MPRAERLLDVTGLLRSLESTTVESLAARLGVSPRTVHRDLATLRERGLPITGEAGRGGGIRLEGDRGITAAHLSIAEVVALWLAARLCRAGTDLPWSEAARSGLAKLLGSVPSPRARELRALCRRVIVGPPATASVGASAGVTPRGLLDVFERAFARRVGLGFAYTDRRGQLSARRIEPHGLLIQPPVWYILGLDADKREPRMFRMDRVQHPRLLPDLQFRPDTAVIDALLQPFEWQPLSAP